MTEHAVVIAGGGPTGLMLAGELALAGVDVAIVERRTSHDLVGSRSGGLHARTLEVLDQRGIADRFMAEGQVAQIAGFSGVRLDISDLPTRRNHGLGLWQTKFERILAGWAVDDLGARIYRGREVTGLTQDESGVEITLSDGQLLRAAYLVGCDGGRSLVRKAAGIAFPGSEPTTGSLLAEVEMTEEPPLGIHRTALGMHSFGRVDYEIRDGKVVFADHGPVQVMVTEREVGGDGGEPTLRDLREGLIAACGTDYGVRSAAWISRFTDGARQAATYRKGRVLVAGDAAHIHPPDGGQGLQTGVQDAVNLGWKLAQVVKGVTQDSLLDSYHAERHPVAARVLRNALASVAVRRDDDRTKALRETMLELLGVDGARRHFAAMMSGLDIRYDFGAGHALLGRRMPDLELQAADGPQRVYALLAAGRPLLLDLGAAPHGGAPSRPETLGAMNIAPWADRVRLVEATYAGPWELPVVGAVPAPAAVLVRPDGHVAWVGDGASAAGEPGLAKALSRWFGPPRAA